MLHADFILKEEEEEENEPGAATIMGVRHLSNHLMKLKRVLLWWGRRTKEISISCEYQDDSLQANYI
jgi:hypothetical protein